jgi:hypothetical protein
MKTYFERMTEVIAKRIALLEFPDVEQTWDDPNSPVALRKAAFLEIAEKIFHDTNQSCFPPPK